MDRAAELLFCFVFELPRTAHSARARRASAAGGFGFLAFLFLLAIFFSEYPQDVFFCYPLWPLGEAVCFCLVVLSVGVDYTPPLGFISFVTSDGMARRKISSLWLSPVLLLSLPPLLLLFLISGLGLES